MLICCRVRVLLGFLFVKINQSVTLYFKASPCRSWVCLGTSLNEHLSLWCHQWHSDDPGRPVWHAGYSPAMTSPRQTQCQTERCCSSHYSSCKNREGVVYMETAFRQAPRPDINQFVSQIYVPEPFSVFHSSLLTDCMNS